MNNPATAKVVNPTNFASSFGSGYSLRRVTSETTTVWLTRKIEAKLPWRSSPAPASGDSLARVEEWG